MLKEVAKKYYDADYNCAESVLHAGNEYYRLGLCEHDMRMAGAFGGGIQTGDLCGALAGAVCVVSAKYIETRAHQHKEELKAVTETLLEKFRERLGSSLCREIKEVHFNEETRCLNTVMLAAQALEDVIAGFEAQR